MLNHTHDFQHINSRYGNELYLLMFLKWTEMNESEKNGVEEKTNPNKC